MMWMGTSDTARSRQRSTKKDYKALGAVIRDLGVQVVFSLILPIKQKGFERSN